MTNSMAQFEPHPDARPYGDIVAMKDWQDARQQWVVVICQVFENPDGRQGIVIYDVGSAETQVEADDWARETIAAKPWERAHDGEELSKGDRNEPR